MFFWILYGFFIMFLFVSTNIFIKKVNLCIQRLEGKIRWKEDLKIVKDVINFNMKIAFFIFIIYICLLILALIHFFIFRKALYLLALFFMGLVSFITGIYNKKYEDKIKNLELFEIEPDVGKTFTSYLEQWSKRQISLKEEP